MGPFPPARAHRHLRRRAIALRSLLALVGVLATISVAFLNLGGLAAAAGSEPEPCAAPIKNPIACENSKPGDPPGDWQIKGIGDKTIQGFATAISVNPGGTENFKIDTDASKYNIRILRLGWYKGDGARVIEPAFKPSAKLPQEQPSCMHEESTGLTDCGNWVVSASWKVPGDAVSGLYMAELEREDTGGESQIFFVVKNEESHASIVLKTSDATWEAYNAYGGNSLYSCTNAWCPEGKPEAYKAAYAVSYNRPFDGTIETDAGQSAPFYAEYQMIRFLERNGYDMTYLAQPDIQAHPELLKNHKLFISSGHDEYWSGDERAAVESAREAGINLAFFSGNEVFWKTRYGPSMEGTANRTLISYKETHFNEPVDPQEPNAATSSWGDARFKAGGAAKPANSLTGQYFLVNAGTTDIKVPGTFAKLRFWRNTAVSKLASNETLTLSPGTGTLGYEWDVDPDNGFRPTGRISLSSTTANNLQTFTDYGTKTLNESLATHSLSLYRAPSGALVFGAGTVDWSWGLDNTNAWDVSSTDPSENPPDPTMQQATVNLFADMGVQPSTLQEGLVQATETTDKTPPETTISSPIAGKTVNGGEAIGVTGTASDVGGVVAGVEVSVDGGKTWHPATGTTSWNYTWNVDGATSATIRARAIDDSGNIGAPTPGVTVPINCPCSMLGALTPSVADAGDGGAINVGIKFQSEIAGTVQGIRFFKSAANIGTHVGTLYSAGGEPLAQATFTNETTSGWQQVNFTTPVKIQANTTYVASYFAPKGHYADTAWSLNEPPATGSSILSHPPMRILADTEGGNGLYTYGSQPGFPTKSYHADNYWVDVLYKPSTPPVAPGQPASVSATGGRGQAAINWSAPTTGGAVASYKITPYVGTAAQTPVTASSTETTKTITGLTAGTAYTFTVTAINEGGTGPESAKSNAITPTAITVPGVPTGVGATAGGASATVTWTAPGDNGGSAITGYKLTPYKEGFAQTPVTAAAGETTKTIGGLTANSSYTFTVIAVNAIGQSAESSPSGAVAPKAAAAPGAPTAVGATAKGSGALVTWTAPTEDGGSTISGYRITPYLGSVAQAPTTTSTTATNAAVTGLANGSAYTFKVAAINGVGTGAESAASAPVTPYDTIFDLATPGTVDAGDGGAVNVGVKFTSDTPGKITGIRFYKAATNTGTHVGTLWSAGGESLAQVTFTGETETGWQQATFATPVQIKANTTYVASYLAPKGHYSANGPNLATAIEDPPLHAQGGAANGVYIYGSGTKFPTEVWQSSNYWVDVLFVPEASASAPAVPTGVNAVAGTASATVTWAAPAENGGSPVTSYTVTPYKEGLAQTPVTAAAGEAAKTISGLSAGSSYTFTVIAVNSVGQSPQSAPSNAVTPVAAATPGAPTGVAAVAKSSGALVTWTAPIESGGSPITGYRITPYLGGVAQTATTTNLAATSATVAGLTNGSAYTFKVAAINAVGTGSDSTPSVAVTPGSTIFELGTPATVDTGEARAINVGVKFRSDVPGQVTGIRFYKAANNTGTHVGTLWTAGGEVLAQATFANETASGWQQVSLSTPVQIQANTTYVASYLAPAGHTSGNGPNLATAVDNPPLHAESAGGLYTFGATTKFPGTNYENSNYWVDVLFAPELAPGTPAAPTATAGFGSATVNWAAPTGGGPVTSYVVTPYVGSTAGTPKTIIGNPPGTSTSFGELSPGTPYTFTVRASNGAGSSADSASSNSVTPSGGSVPSAPIAVTAQARNGAAVVSWAPPAENGGSAITGYKVTPYLGSEALAATTVGGEATSVTVGSLINGSSYTFQVSAANSVGSGAASAATQAVVPRITIFEQSVPTTAEATDSSSVILGVKFGSTVAGKVRGIRFYKAPGNVGPHSVGLWTSSGSLLASATATNETASGWQEVSFPAPVSIAANTMYVAAYLAPKGHYSSTSQAFSAAITNPPLVALANGTSVNGLYSYRSTLSFPVSSYQATSYWVDVMFTP
jgi:predicted phage tail protein